MLETAIWWKFYHFNKTSSHYMAWALVNIKLYFLNVDSKCNNLGNILNIIWINTCQELKLNTLKCIIVWERFDTMRISDVLK